MSLLTKVTEVFQKVIDQGGRCTDDAGGCVYTSPCGTRHCAVGHLLTTEEQQQVIDLGLNDDANVHALCDKLEGLIETLAPRLDLAGQPWVTVRDALCILQETHDAMCGGETLEILLTNFKHHLLENVRTEHLAKELEV